MKALFGQEPVSQLVADSHASRGFVEKYRGTRLNGVRQNSYQRTTDVRVSPTDPDAAPMNSSNKASSVLGYHGHLSIFNAIFFSKLLIHWSLLPTFSTG
jgi:hypothetical protein